MSLVRFFNGVDKFQIAIQLDENPPMKITPMTFKEIYLPPGQHKLKVLFNHRGKLEELNSRLIVSAGTMFTVVTMVSPETTDRPTLKAWDDTEQMNSALELLNSTEEDQ